MRKLRLGVLVSELRRHPWLLKRINQTELLPRRNFHKSIKRKVQLP